MENFCFITKNDFELINVAFQRKLDHCLKQGYDVRLFSYLDYLLYNSETPTGQILQSHIEDLGLASPMDTCFLATEFLQNRTFILENRHPARKYSNSHSNVYGFHTKENLIMEELLKKITRIVIKKEQNHIPSRIYGVLFPLNPPSVHPARQLENFLRLDDYKELMSTLLREKLEEIEPIRRLSCIVNLLIVYHYGDECELFMSLAIKLCLKACQLSFCNFYEEGKCARCFFTYFNLELLDFMEFIHKNKCSVQLLVDSLKVLYITAEQRITLFQWPSNLLEYVLETIQTTDLKIPNLLNHHDLGRIRASDLCFTQNFKNFALLVTFGAGNTYSREDWDIIKNMGMNECDNDVINNIIRNDSGEGLKLYVYGQSSLRLYQTLHSYHKRELGGQSRFEAEFALKLLWASIPDPYISEKEVREYLNEPHFVPISRDLLSTPNLCRFCFMYCESAHTRRGKERVGTLTAVALIESWEWYRKVVLNGDSPVKSPRSLLHLSRCAIRQSLAVNSRLSKGVQLLNLPSPMIDYLLLKDCGDNPYENN